MSTQESLHSGSPDTVFDPELHEKFQVLAVLPDENFRPRLAELIRSDGLPADPIAPSQPINQ